MIYCSQLDFPLLNVRRRLFKPSTTAGKGTKWEWLSLITSDWNAYNIDVQNVLEDAWSNGIHIYDFQKSSLNLPYRINFKNMTEIRQPNGPTKNIRRTQQAPYPLLKVTPDDQLFDIVDPIDRSATVISNSGCQVPPPLPPPHTKAKKLFPNLGKSRPQMPLPADTLQHPSSSSSSSNGVLNATTASVSCSIMPSASSSSSSTKLARQIFNNLNIFSHKPHNNHSHQSTHFDTMPHSSRHSDHGNCHVRRLSSKSTSSTASTQNLIASRRCRKSYRSHEDDFYAETDGASSCCSATTSSGGGGVGSRRPSIDTISTYLSHDSNEMLQFGNNESTYAGDDDDVFLPAQPKGTIVGVDPDSDMISRFVSVVEPPKWPNCRPCAMCLEELQHAPNNPVVSLVRCEHMMHLNCLNHLIISQSNQQHQQVEKKLTSLFIECPVCGIVYGEKYGNQPNGTMTWSVIPKQLAGHEGQNTIQIIYK